MPSPFSQFSPQISVRPEPPPLQGWRQTPACLQSIECAMNSRLGRKLHGRSLRKERPCNFLPNREFIAHSMDCKHAGVCLQPCNGGGSGLTLIWGENWENGEGMKLTTVLVVDDDAEIRQALAELLEDEDY